jgi:hypothetical protein
MRIRNNASLVAALIGMTLGAISLAAHGETSKEELQRLGKDLTFVGAEKAGNADGSIPPWDGGLAKPPAGFNRENGYLNPFANEKPLYVVTAANQAQYQALLAPGQIEMLKRYPDSYVVKVYPTHRTAALPQSEYDAIKDEAPSIKLAAGGVGMIGLKKSSVPFPVPKNGLELIWNHQSRFRFASAQRNFALFAVQTNGGFTPIRWAESQTRAAYIADAEPNRLFYFMQHTLSPSNAAGEATLCHNPQDLSVEPRKCWTYNPGQRRVLRAPDVSHDTPFFNVDGLATIDDYDMWSGATDRFDWKLIGKKEMLIPYNNYDLTKRSLKYADIIKLGHLNQDLVRYEKHRVWVLEATLKPGQRHIYGKRVFYLDEDSWTVVHADQYDGRGNLWRVHETNVVQFYDIPALNTAGEVQYDLQARRYFAAFFTNEEKLSNYNVKRSLSFYSVDNLRKLSN